MDDKKDQAVYPLSEEDRHALYSDDCECGVKVETVNGHKIYVHERMVH